MTDDRQTPAGELTELLVAWRSGKTGSLEKLIPLVYKELHRMAHLYIRGERLGHTLQTTALIHEAYLRLIDARKVDWTDRAHFFAIAARTMRRILVDSARARRAVKRGGGAVAMTLDESALIAGHPDPDLAALDDALTALENLDERKCRVVELRYFGGMTATETAAVLGVSEDTVLNDWKLARVWLLHEMRGGADPPRQDSPG